MSAESLLVDSAAARITFDDVEPLHSSAMAGIVKLTGGRRYQRGGRAVTTLDLAAELPANDGGQEALASPREVLTLKVTF